MTNFEKFCDAFDEYCEMYGFDKVKLGDLHTESYNDKEGNYLYSGENIDSYSMDIFIKQIYQNKFGQGEVNDRPSSVDGLIINEKNDWYFIEFKDKKLSTTDKEKLVKKVCCNILTIVDVLINVKNEKGICIDFDYENPINFFRNHLFYIVVISKEKNINLLKSFHNQKLLGKVDKFRIEQLERLKGYYYKDTYIFDEVFFAEHFISNFVF